MDLSRDIASDQEPQSTPEAETTADTAALSPNPSTSSDSGVSSVKTPKCCGLPTIAEGCCEEKESPVVDIEDILGDFDKKGSDGSTEIKGYLSVLSEDG